MPRKKMKKNIVGASLLQNVAKFIQSAVKTASADELAEALRNPTEAVDLLAGKMADTLDSEQSPPLSKQVMRRAESKQVKPKASLSPQEKEKQNTQNRLVLLLADNHRFGIDDLHRYWQDFVDPMVEWSYETRKMTQRQLATELVRKARQQKRLAELENAVDAMNMGNRSHTKAKK